MSEYLIADLGGTSFRAARSAGNQIFKAEEVANKNFPSFASGIEWYARKHGVPDKAVLGIAAPPTDPKSIRFTNIPQWGDVNFVADCKAVGIGKVHLVNDFHAQAAALTVIKPGPENFRAFLDSGWRPFYPYDIASSIKVREGQIPTISANPAEDKRIVILGPGTGLGVATAHINKAGQYVILNCEGGHMEFPARTRREWDIVETLQVEEEKAGRSAFISYETIASGTGLVKTFNAIAALDNRDIRVEKAEEVTELAKQNHPAALETFEMFTKSLARAAKTMVLATSASTVFISGGIPGKLGKLFNAETFAANFIPNDLDNSRNNVVADVPVVLMQAENAGLLGAHALAQHHFAIA